MSDFFQRHSKLRTAFAIAAGMGGAAAVITAALAIGAVTGLTTGFTALALGATPNISSALVGAGAAIPVMTGLELALEAALTAYDKVQKRYSPQNLLNKA